MIRIVHLGDIHLYRLLVPPSQLLSKRLFGMMNLWVNRRFRFKPALLGPVVNKAASLRPDLALLTGDLTTTAQQDEIEDVATALRPLINHFATLIIPGNHDCYTRAAARNKALAEALPEMVPWKFPHARTLGPRWHLLALDAAVPSLFTARGRLRRWQLQRAQQFVRALRPEDGLVVMCHYPFTLPAGVRRRWSHELADAAELRKVLASCKARILYLHGHEHRPWHLLLDNDLSHVTVVNAGSPTMISSQHPRGQGFWEIELDDDPRNPKGAIGLIHHEPAPADELTDALTWTRKRVL